MTLKSYSAADVTSMVLNKENVFLLDVRSENNYNDWKIESENFDYLNKPYFELEDGIEPIIDQLPKDREILVVCARERTSKMIAEKIALAGMDVAYLEGGMRGWSEALHQTKVYEDEKMKVYQFIRVGKGCLSYMVISDGEALIVDPARFTDVYERAARAEGAQITHIVDSHLHADHISGGKELADKTGANYYIMKSEGAVFDFEALENYNTINFSNVTVEVIAVKTPGHTPGSVSFFVNDKLLFSGDTIFISGLGRPDLGNKVREWAQDLYDTVHSKVSDIADGVVVLPGHYADLDLEINEQGFIGDTLGDIRKRNEKMFTASKEEFLETVEKSASSVKPPNFEDIVAINRGETQADLDELQDLEIGPNRCAVHHTA